MPRLRLVALALVAVAALTVPANAAAKVQPTVHDHGLATDARAWSAAGTVLQYTTVLAEAEISPARAALLQWRTARGWQTVTRSTAPDDHGVVSVPVPTGAGMTGAHAWRIAVPGTASSAPAYGRPFTLRVAGPRPPRGYVRLLGRSCWTNGLGQYNLGATIMYSNGAEYTVPNPWHSPLQNSGPFENSVYADDGTTYLVWGTDNDFTGTPNPVGGVPC